MVLSFEVIAGGQVAVVFASGVVELVVRIEVEVLGVVVKKNYVLFLWPHLLMLLLLLLIWYCFNHWLCQNEPECLLVVKRRQGKGSKQENNEKIH